MQKLRQAGFVEHYEIGSRKDAFLQLTLTGHRAIRQSGVEVDPWPTVRRRRQPNPWVLDHDRQVYGVKAAFAQAAKFGGCCMRAFTADTPMPEGSRGRAARQASVKPRPDAYMALEREQQIDHFFVEVDRGTESLRRIRDKATAYRVWHRSGDAAAAICGVGSPANAAPFRVLFICSSQVRRDNMASSLLEIEPPVLSQCCFATMEDVEQAPLGLIWLTPHALRRSKRGGSDLELQTL